MPTIVLIHTFTVKDIANLMIATPDRNRARDDRKEYQRFMFGDFLSKDAPKAELLKGSILEKQFNELSEKWKEETGGYSNTYYKFASDRFLDLISLGKEIVPLILKDIQKGGPAHWHKALVIFTKQNPIPDGLDGNNREIKRLWVEWGKKTGLI